MKTYSIQQYKTFTNLDIAIQEMRIEKKIFGHKMFLLKKKIDTLTVYVLSEAIFNNHLKTR